MTAHLNILPEKQITPAAGADRRCSTCAKATESPRGIVQTENGEPAWQANPCCDCAGWTPADTPAAAEEVEKIEAFALDQVAQICGTTIGKVYWWIRTKQLRTFKYQGASYVREEDLIAFRAGQAKEKAEWDAPHRSRGRPRKDKEPDSAKDLGLIGLCEAAKILKVTYQTTVKLVQQGRLLRALHPGNRIRLRRVDVEAFSKTYVRYCDRPRKQPAQAPKAEQRPTPAEEAAGLVSLMKAAKLTGYSEATIKGWNEKGWLEAERLPNGHYLFNLEDLRSLTRNYRPLQGGGRWRGGHDGAR